MSVPIYYGRDAMGLQIWLEERVCCLMVIMMQRACFVECCLGNLLLQRKETPFISVEEIWEIALPYFFSTFLWTEAY